MSEKIEDTIKLLIDEGRRKGYLTITEMNRLLDDQFLLPDRLDQVLQALEDQGIDVIEDDVDSPDAMLAATGDGPADRIHKDVLAEAASAEVVS